ncbi:MAG: hypothetical protein ABI356_09055 [Steroidobacteraceae bacterium]
MHFQLLRYVGQVAPFLRRYGDPLDAAAAGEQSHRNCDQTQPNPDGPPVFLAEQLAPWRAPAKRLTINSVNDFRHEDSG